ncbi:predicted protein [Naegleria gruberi]|uniref:Predicted protein n=1 Tax=Naegleria gruberi TaxID=5762 RepID=D2VKL8_NAEGR|nr:uncharacterized protein NAEGRDRAFT_69439 [Naegleria gruberi]EFC42619.1 predicted protein [Naegleria gruberi]|eukprot:XP_002675363.1 predicted protein [Naegleria gruberi strain NEG-M]
MEMSLDVYLRKHLFANSKPLSTKLDIIEQIIEQVGIGIHSLHSKELAHRDLKEANILVSGSNKLFICLCDFDFVNDNLTTSLSIVGTPKYLPPEMISQGILLKKNSTKIDIWCFGIIIFRILCELLGIDCFSDCPEEILVEDDIRLGRAKDSEQLRQYLDKKLSTSELLINYTLGEGRRITRFIELTRQLLEYQYEKRPNASTLIELIQTP